MDCSCEGKCQACQEATRRPNCVKKHERKYIKYTNCIENKPLKKKCNNTPRYDLYDAIQPMFPYSERNYVY
jgi:hypothetical protein